MKRTKAILPMDIGEVASHSGLRPSTLRFYEEKGLIQSTGRYGLRRLFGPNTLERLEFIALAQKAGFSLQDIAAMLDSRGDFRIDRKQLFKKANELENNIKQLIAVTHLLKHVAECSAPNQFDCPKFQRLLRLAGKIQKKARGANQPRHSK